MPGTSKSSRPRNTGECAPETGQAEGTASFTNILLGEDNDATKADERSWYNQAQARRALGHALSSDGEAAHSDSAMWNRPNSVLEALQNVLLDGGAAAASDETFLEQTKLRAQEAPENALLYADTTAASEEAWLQRAKLKAQGALRFLW